jgi:hypothetical protein
LTVFLQSLENFDEELRGLLVSRQLRQRADTKPADVLLTAVWQHLDWGGLTNAEIAQLVPDGNGTRGAADRVRKRVDRPNVRCMMPREPSELGPTVSDDKRRKRHSSG